jgi:hypothetical protein
MRALPFALPLIAALIAAGCDDLLSATSTTTTTVAPVTGLRVRASTMLDGLGCGTGARDPFKWGGAVRVKGSTDILATHVVDCFADLVFHDLPVTDAAVDTYAIDLVAFTNSAWATVPSDTQALLVEGRRVDVTTLPATWRSSCEGVQEQGIRRDAVCVPFTAVDAGAPSDADAGVDAGAPVDAASAPDASP